MNEAVTKRFLLYFRLMLLVWILIVNSILHVVGFAYSWLIFLSNIMLFTMEGDIKDRFVSVELGGLVGMVFTVIALLAITFLTPVLGSFFGFLIPLAVVLFVLIILHPYAPKVLNNVGFAYLTVACIDAAALLVPGALPVGFGIITVGARPGERGTRGNNFPQPAAEQRAFDELGGLIVAALQNHAVVEPEPFRRAHAFFRRFAVDRHGFFAQHVHPARERVFGNDRVQIVRYAHMHGV